MNYVPSWVRRLTVEELSEIAVAARESCASFEAMKYRTNDRTVARFQSDMARLAALTSPEART